MASRVKPAVVLLSGGLDSATVLAFAPVRVSLAMLSRSPMANAMRWSWRPRSASPSRWAAQDHRTLHLDLRAFGGSALTADVPVPRDRDEAAMSAGIPITYVPARNTVFLALALAWAEVLESFDIFVGVNAVDYSGYPDCRPEFVRAFEGLANLATKAGVENKGRFRIHTPLIEKTKAEIIHMGASLGVDFGMTHSCYDPAADGAACGRCDSCRIRRAGFVAAGLHDPTHYAPTVD